MVFHRIHVQVMLIKTKTQTNTKAWKQPKDIPIRGYSKLNLSIESPHLKLSKLI